MSGLSRGKEGHEEISSFRFSYFVWTAPVPKGHFVPRVAAGHALLVSFFSMTHFARLSD